MVDGKAIECSGTVALCRCGGSANKPFCDGTHGKIGFTGDKDPDRTPDKRENYAGKRVTIHDNRGLCAHAGRCTDGLPAVFKYGQEPWIDPDGAGADEIIAAVKRCPSGALSYSVDGVEHSERGGEPAIAFAPNGPYVCTGGCAVEAELMEGATLDHFDLCRCGKSTNKPFCSGAHWDHQFDEQAGAKA
jgi:CDGSH-type Zn-finger protein